MKKIWQACKAYPIAVVFFVFLMGFSVLDALWPKRAYSELENRDLAQKPQFSIASVVSRQNPWMVQYESYVKDQFAFRDGWIDLKSYAEAALLKTENNDVYYGSDDYLFKQLLGVDESRFARNVTALANLCERHPGMVDAMIVPSASLVLKDKLPANAPGLDEDAHLDEIYSAVQAAGGNVFDMRETLGSHAEEYIFYRTDHHWTDLGAWYAYEAWAQANDLALFDRSAAQAVTVEDFYGTNYSRARKPGIVPDTITYYDLPNILSVEDNAGGEVTWEIGPLYEYSDFETRDKYKAFLRGNNAYSVLEGSGEGSILVVKDSYANAFIPYLVENYAQIGIVDLRYTVEKVDSFIQRGGYDKVLVLYSFAGFAEDTNFASRAGIAG